MRRTAARFLARDERLAEGKSLRQALRRQAHGAWRISKRQRDPIALLEESNRGRLQDLIPIRYGRMIASPFAFLRGSAVVMAHDLATVGSTGIRVQACGDCHLSNFGLFASPERKLVFDINDFDETLPAPWEWDVKRLAVSFAVAAREAGQPDRRVRTAAVRCVASYREHLREDSKRSPLEVWYERMDEEALLELAGDPRVRRIRAERIAEARGRVGEAYFPKISAPLGGGRHRLVDAPPLTYHPTVKHAEKIFREALDGYRRSMQPALRVLFDRYELQDFAIRVVGVGSVGTRCYVALFVSADGDPLLLQFKEARPSVLARYAGGSAYANEGERVVVGQRLMQSASDHFLGWTRSAKGFDFYGRQLRDMKWSAPVIEGAASPILLNSYAALCGRVLARAHAKSGDSAMISGYLGKSDAFDEAVGDFALRYADQTERDHAALVAAVRAGRIDAAENV